MSTALDNVAVFPVRPEEQVTESAKSKQRVKDNDGLHRRGQVWHTRTRVNGKWRELSLGTKNHTEARRTREQKIAEFIERLELPDLASLTLEKATPLWLAEREKLVSPGTYRIDRARVAQLKKRLGGMRLSDFRAEDLRSYQLTRVGKGKGKAAPSTINCELKVLRLILKSARCWSRIADHYKPLRESKSEVGKALTADQETKLFEVAMADPHASPVYFAAVISAHTTMRGCELKRLRLADVNLIDQIVTVRRSSTKTDAGARAIPLNSDAVWAFARLLERASLLKAVEPTHFLFPRFSCRRTHDSDGKPIKGATGYDPTRHQISWRTSWTNLLKKAGLPSSFRYHDLRHHSISRLAELGIGDQTIMSIAGHVSRRMLDHYCHIRTEARRAAVAALETKKHSVPLPMTETNPGNAHVSTERVN